MRGILALALLGLVGLVSSNGAFSDETGFDAPETTDKGIYQISGNWSQLKRGWNTLSLKVTDTANNSVSGAKVTVVYEMFEMPMNPPDKPVAEKGDGVYEKPVFLGMRGRWKFDIDVNANSTEDTLAKLTTVTK